jgi:hypothetical protein
LSARVPEPFSRRSQARPASSDASIDRRLVAASSGAVMQTISLSISGSAASRSSAGGLPEIATSTA